MREEVASMANIHYPTGQGIREINSRTHQVYSAEGEEPVSRLSLYLNGMKKILGIVFVVAILAYAIVQPWVSQSIIDYFRSIGFIQY
jgi:hypothetical protein